MQREITLLSFISVPMPDPFIGRLKEVIQETGQQHFPVSVLFGNQKNFTKDHYFLLKNVFNWLETILLSFELHTVCSFCLLSLKL